MATTITTLPDAPSRTDPSTFSTKSDALLGALATFVTETNTVAGECVSNAAIATTQAGLATTNGAAQVSLATAQVVLATEQVALATTQAGNAANSATASANSALVAGAIAWVSGTTYAIGNTRYSPINFQTYRRTTSGAGTTDPSLDTTNWTKALVSGVESVTTATTATTLTSTPTLLKITPESYGVAVTLPDATTCNIGGPVHIVDNKGAYVVRLLNSDGTVRGFCTANEVTTVSLIDNSTAVGVWAMAGGNIGVSAQLLSVLRNVDAVIDIGSSQEVIVGRGQTSANCYAVVYNRSTNTFGSATLVRTATFGTGLIHAVLSGSNQVLVISVPTASTAFEAVTLSISGTTITVNTAATATLSSNINTFGDGCGLVVVGSSFVTSYSVTAPAAQLRAMTISGTTVTIGSASHLDVATSAALVAVSDSTHVIVAYTVTTHLFTALITISGATVTYGSSTDTNSGTMTLNKFAALGSRWVVLYNDGGSTCKGGIVSLSGATLSISTVTLFAASTIADAIVLSSSKVLVLNAATTSNANILTDTAGTAGAGTAITTTAGTSRVCVSINGTDAWTIDTDFTHYFVQLDCSSTSPVMTSITACGTTSSTTVPSAASNKLLARSPLAVYSTGFASDIYPSQAALSRIQLAQLINNKPVVVLNKNKATVSVSTVVRGLSERETWAGDNLAGISKTECAA